MKKKVAITGATGMLGRSLLRILNLSPDEYEVTGMGLNRAKPPLRKIDLLNTAEITSFMDEIRPDIVVHCAAERDPDTFAKNPDRARALNVQSTTLLTSECGRVGAILIYISTSYVFDGGVKSKVLPPYKPDSVTMPLNGYGESKLAGENEVMSLMPNSRWIVVRVPILYASDCADLSESSALVLAEALRTQPSKEPTKKKKVDDWADRFPTLVDDVSVCLKRIIDSSLSPTTDQLPGKILHISSPEMITKYKLSMLMAEILDVDGSHLVPNRDVPADDSAAPRPKKTQLDCTDTWKALGGEPHAFVSLRDGISLALEPFRESFQ